MRHQNQSPRESAVIGCQAYHRPASNCLCHHRSVGLVRPVHNPASPSASLRLLRGEGHAVPAVLHPCIVLGRNFCKIIHNMFVGCQKTSPSHVASLFCKRKTKAAAPHGPIPRERMRGVFLGPELAFGQRYLPVAPVGPSRRPIAKGSVCARRFIRGRLTSRGNLTGSSLFEGSFCDIDLLRRVAVNRKHDRWRTWIFMNIQGFSSRECLVQVFQVRRCS